MTYGHKHREVGLPQWVIYLLRKPVYYQHDIDRVDASPYPYGEKTRYVGGVRRPVWYLSTLSILHRWTGLAVYVKKGRGQRERG